MFSLILGRDNSLLCWQCLSLVSLLKTNAWNKVNHAFICWTKHGILRIRVPFRCTLITTCEQVGPYRAAVSIMSRIHGTTRMGWVMGAEGSGGFNGRFNTNPFVHHQWVHGGTSETAWFGRLGVNITIRNRRDCWVLPQHGFHGGGLLLIHEPDTLQ